MCWVGNGHGDVLLGGAGADLIFGDGGFSPALQALIAFDDTAGFSLNPGFTTFTKGGRDKILGGAGDDILSGGVLGDTVKGGAGRDLLFGEAGTDEMNGGKGNDRLIGGGGMDVMTGGLGQDSFIYFNPNEGGDRITDFDPTQDAIELFAPVFKIDEFRDTIRANQFRVGREAKTRMQKFIYNKNRGVLSFDPDGSGSKDAIVLATLEGKPNLTFANIRPEFLSDD